MKNILGRTDGRTDRRTDGRTDRGKTVYPPHPPGSGGIITGLKPLTKVIGLRSEVNNCNHSVGISEDIQVQQLYVKKCYDIIFLLENVEHLNVLMHLFLLLCFFTILIFIITNLKQELIIFQIHFTDNMLLTHIFLLLGHKAGRFSKFYNSLSVTGKLLTLVDLMIYK